MTVHHRIADIFTVRNIVISIGLAVVVAKDCVDAILLALINETDRMAEIIVTIAIFRSLRDKSCTGSVLLIANPTACNISLHIVIIERQFIRQLCSYTNTAFLSLADPPVHPRDLIYAESIGVRQILRPLAAHIDHDSITRIDCLTLLEIVSDRLTEFEFRFLCGRLFQNDVHNTAHRLSTVKR